MASRYEITGVYLGLVGRSTCFENQDGTQTIIATIDTGETRPIIDMVDSGGVTPWGSFIDVPAERDEREPITRTIKGTIFPGELVRGLTYTFIGQDKNHEKYGTQFCFDSFVVSTPAGEEAVVAYLTQCNGIGPVCARNIYREFRDESVAILREHPGKVAASVPRLTKEKAIEASSLLRKWEGVEKTKISLLGLLKGRGFPKRTVDALIKKFGAEAASLVRRNPFVLLKFSGCGFDKVDKMYCQLGLNPSRMKRQSLCAWYGVKSQNGGNTWCDFSVVRTILRERISSASVDEERAMRLAVRAGLLSETWHNGQRLVAERELADQEDRLAELIDEASKESLRTGIQPEWLSAVDEIEGLSEHQSEQIKIALNSHVAILSGLPGCGKTWLAARLIQVLANRHGSHSIAVGALAGKAAVKITSEMDKIGLSVQATTIHSLLGQGDANGFHHCRVRPLPQRFIFIDEFSMPGVPLALALLEARDEGTHVLFIGDENQLPPIEHGCPLRDMIIAGVSRGHLTEIKRQGTVSRIVRACHEIVKHSRFTPSPKFNPADGEDFLFIERETAQDQVDTLAALIQNQQQKRDQSPDESIDPIWDMQIIVPINGKSELGRRPLNLKLQNLFNPEGRRVSGNPFRVGDKIVCRKSGDYKSATESCMGQRPREVDAFATPADEPVEATMRIRNGEMAEVLDVTPTSVVARLTFPDREIIIRRAATAERDAMGASEDSGDESDSEDKSTGTGCDWELGYACSGHAYQGCEVHTAIVMIDPHPSAKMVSSKQWIFTGFSRGKQRLIAIGQMKVALDMCRRDMLRKRRTLLAEKILALRSRVEMTHAVRELLLEGVGA